MSYKNKYIIRDSMYGSGLRDIKIKNTVRKVKSTFKDSPSYYLVLMSTASTPLDEAFEIDAQIVDSTDIRDEKKLTTFYDVSLSTGCIIYWQDRYWLATHYEPMSEIYKRAVINRCYSSLKWQDEDNVIREAWFAKKAEASPNFGIDDRNKSISMPDERRQIVLQSNEHTLKIKKEQRFIFDGRCWKVVVDAISEGIINLVLQEDQINPAKDNEELRIVDYKEDVYEISINGISPLSISLSQTLQLDVAAYKNGNQVGVNEINLSSSNPLIGTIDNTGFFTPLSLGQTTITAEYMGESVGVTIEVSNTMADNYSIRITNSTTVPFEIKYNHRKTYESAVFNNGTEEPLPVTFELFADDKLTQTSIATIVSQNNSSCVIQSNVKSGYVQLKSSLVSDGDIFVWTRIKLAALF